MSWQERWGLVDGVDRSLTTRGFAIYLVVWVVVLGIGLPLLMIPALMLWRVVLDLAR